MNVSKKQYENHSRVHSILTKVYEYQSIPKYTTTMYRHKRFTYMLVSIYSAFTLNVLNRKPWIEMGFRGYKKEYQKTHFGNISNF